MDAHLPPHVQSEARRILDAAARRILEQETKDDALSITGVADSLTARQRPRPIRRRRDSTRIPLGSRPRQHI